MYAKLLARGEPAIEPGGGEEGRAMFAAAGVALTEAACDLLTVGARDRDGLGVMGRASDLAGVMGRS